MDVSANSFLTEASAQRSSQDVGVNKAVRKGRHGIHQVLSVDPFLTGNSVCYEFKVRSGLYSIGFRLVTQLPENSGVAEGWDDRSDKVNVKSSVKPAGYPEGNELEWDPFMPLKPAVSSVDSDSSATDSLNRYLASLPLAGNKNPHAVFENTSSLNSTSVSFGFPEVLTESLNVDKYMTLCFLDNSQDLCGLEAGKYMISSGHELTGDSHRYSGFFLRQIPFDTYSARGSAVSGQSELSLTNTLSSSTESVGVNTAGCIDSTFSLNSLLTNSSIPAEQENCTDFESTGCPNSASNYSRFSEVSSGAYSAGTRSVVVDSRDSGKKRKSSFFGFLRNIFACTGGIRDGSSTIKLNSSADASSFLRYSGSLKSQASRDSGVSGCSSSGEISLPHSLNRSPTVNSCAAPGLFTNGHKIRTIAGNISHSTVSKTICDSLITYDQKNISEWYKEAYSDGNRLIHTVERFMLQTFTYWLGWCDKSGNNKNPFSKSGKNLNEKFLFWVENNAGAFERIAEVSQLLSSVKRAVGQCIAENKKTIGPVQLYEILSFNESKKNDPKEESGAGGVNNVTAQNSLADSASASGSLQLSDSGEDLQKISGLPVVNEQLLNNCSSGIIFSLLKLSKLIDSMGDSVKYKTKKKKIMKELNKHTIVEKPKERLSLLNACISYNLAVVLIEREYNRAGLNQYDPARRVEGELACNTDYSRFESDDLEVINSLLKLIDALDQEAGSILHQYKTELDGLPKKLQDKSFEERVLHLRKSGKGYISDPLKGMKTTLLLIQSGSKQKNPVDYFA
nr:hypothetical protein [Endozoicomonas sp.]